MCKYWSQSSEYPTSCLLLKLNIDNTVYKYINPFSLSFMCPLCFALLTSTTPPPKLHLTILGSALAESFPTPAQNVRGVCLISKCTLHGNFGRCSQPFRVGTALFGLGGVSLALYGIVSH